MHARKASFDAIGTKWTIEIFSEISVPQWAKIQRKLRERIELFDKTYSRFRKDSLVWEMSQKAGHYKMPDDGYKLFSFYQKMYRATEGRVTPLIGNLLSDIGYDENYTFKPKETRKIMRLEDVFDFDHTQITIKTPAILDFGAAGKGYLVDIVGQLLRTNDVEDFTINAGGDILHSTPKGNPIIVGLENPDDHNQAIGTVEIHNESICASSVSRRQWGDHHHIVDPTTQKPTKGIQATWVVSSSAMHADGFATALFFVEPKSLAHIARFAYARLRDDISLEHSKNLKLKMYSN